MLEKIIRLPEVQKRTGLPRSTVYWKIDNANFPKPIKLGLRSVGWLEGDINQWISDQIHQSKK